MGHTPDPCPVSRVPASADTPHDGWTDDDGYWQALIDAYDDGGAS